MAHVQDVAQYILERRGEITAWKLQKLVYYSQDMVTGLGRKSPSSKKRLASVG